MTITQFIEDFCPSEINISIYNEITCQNLQPGQRTQRQYCSPRYQRRFGAWSSPQKCKYISNIFKGRVYTPIILAPIADKERNLDDQPQTVKFACLDGQHRSCTIAKFINNEFGFTGKINGEIFNNTQFNKLPQALQRRFLLKCKIPVRIVEERGVDLAEIFIDINDGQPLNEQEKRNAINSYIAHWTREQSNKFEDVFKQISGASRGRMDDCVVISRIAKMVTEMTNESNPDTSCSSLTKFYKDGVGNDDYYNTDSLSYISNNFFTSLRTVARAHKNHHNSKIKTRFLFAYLIVHWSLNNAIKEHSINDEELFSFVQQIVTKLDSESNKQFVEDEENGTMESKSNYFHSYTNTVLDPARFSLFRDKICGSFGNNYDRLVSTIESMREKAAA